MSPVPDRIAAGPRYAVYFAPAPDHPLWMLGCEWLGREPDSSKTGSEPARALVATPWRYGFHATLRAPMRLAPGVDAQGLAAAVHRVATRHLPFSMPVLEVGMLSNFLALRPTQPLPAGHAMRRLADDCVLSLNGLRAALGAAERKRQMKPGLDAGQRVQVERFGYAFVLEDWRLHFTLSDPLNDVEPAVVAALTDRARLHFAPALDQPLQCDALGIYVEHAPSLPLQLLVRVPLGRARVATSPPT